MRLSRDSKRPLWRPDFVKLLLSLGFATMGWGALRLILSLMAVKITGQLASTGLSLMLQFGPYIVLAPLSGILAERFARRKILMVTQFGGAIVAVLILVFSGGDARIGLVYGASLLLGVLNAVEAPSRQIVIGDVVGSRHLASAISLGSAVFQAGQLVGFATSGFIIEKFSSGTASVGVMMAFASSILLLALLENPSSKRPLNDAGGDRTKLTTILRSVDLGLTFLIIFVMALLVTTSMVFFAAFALVDFGLGSSGYGTLTAVFAVGGVLGGFLNSLRRRTSLRWLLLAVGLAIALELAIASTRDFSGFVILVLIAGVLNMVWVSTSNSIVQASAPAHLRGRLMATYFLVMMGGVAVGSLILGELIDRVGVRESAYIATGLKAVVIAGVFVFLLLRRKRTAPPRAP